MSAAHIRPPRTTAGSVMTVTPRQSAPASWPIRDELLTVDDVTLESGAHFSQLRVHIRLEGQIAAARDNVVLIVHALTGDVRATTWWRGVVELGGAIDPSRHAVLTANLLGGCDGTAGPRVGDALEFPPFTTRDQAMVLARVLDALTIATPLLVCGGSLGGQVTLEFAASFPSRVRAAVVLAAPATQTAQGLAWNAIMRRAIAIGGPHEGLALARMVGMLSYRTPEGLERRFGRARTDGGEFAVSEWLDVHGKKLVARFDAASYLTLLNAMDTHDVGRGRGGVATALQSVGSRLIGVGVVGDLLYPADCVREWTQSAAAQYVELPSVHGHDAFLLETARVGQVLRDAIAQAHDAGARSDTATSSTATADALAVGPRRTPVLPQENPRPIAPALRVALAGCGHVGGGLLSLLVERSASDTAVRVDQMLVRDAGRDRPPFAQAIARGITTAQARITETTHLFHEHTNVFVELIGGTTTARTLVEAALRRGIRVVTANKALLAECGPYLQTLADANSTRLDFEGAVGGAIPIVRCIRSGAAGVGIHGVSGILNGTSNFVLDRISAGASLSEAIVEAQQRGLAEADPTRDLSGEDAEDKLRVLAWLAFGVEPASLVVSRRGIDETTAAWAAQVTAAGDAVKVLARCTFDEHGRLTARIEPTRVSLDDPWSRVRDANNRIVIESASAGSLVFDGPGAGGRATAGAVLGDLLSVRE
jgi:homoserine O-acetyltransferase